MTITTAEFHVIGMTCGLCEMYISEEVLEVPGVESVDVNHRTRMLVVTGTGTRPVDGDAVLLAVKDAGYRGVRSA